MCLILTDRFWVVHITFVRMVKFQFVRIVNFIIIIIIIIEFFTPALADGLSLEFEW